LAIYCASDNLRAELGPSLSHLSEGLNRPDPNIGFKIFEEFRDLVCVSDTIRIHCGKSLHGRTAHLPIWIVE
jgi:hypothetical protein